MRETERNRGKQRETERNREKQRETERNREKQREKQENEKERKREKLRRSVEIGFPSSIRNMPGFQKRERIT